MTIPKKAIHFHQQFTLFDCLKKQVFPYWCAILVRCLILFLSLFRAAKNDLQKKLKLLKHGYKKMVLLRSYPKQYHLFLFRLIVEAVNRRYNSS